MNKYVSIYIDQGSPYCTENWLNLQHKAASVLDQVGSIDFQLRRTRSNIASASKEDSARLETRCDTLENILKELRLKHEGVLAEALKFSGAPGFTNLEDETTKLLRSFLSGSSELSKNIFDKIVNISPAWIERKLQIIQFRAEKAGKLDLLFDLFKTGPAPVRSRLRLLAKAASIGVLVGRESEAMELLDIARHEDSNHVRFGPQDHIGVLLTESLNLEFCKKLCEIKYKDVTWGNYKDIFDIAEKISVRFDPDMPFIEQVYNHRSSADISEPEWQRRFSIASCIEHLTRDYHMSPARRMVDFGSYNDLINFSKINKILEELDRSDGLLVLNWHGGLRLPALAALEKLFPGFLTITAAVGKNERAISTSGGAVGSALFTAMRAVSDGKVVMTSQDGSNGNRSHSVLLAGRSIPTANGAALIAYETNCTCLFWTVLPEGGEFVPVCAIAPKPVRREKFEDFSDRWIAFYWEQIDAMMKGDPSRMAIGRLWSVLWNWGT